MASLVHGGRAIEEEELGSKAEHTGCAASKKTKRSRSAQVTDDIGVSDAAEDGILPCVWAPSVVISGHSHRPGLYLDQEQGVLFVNPGSAGPRRFKLSKGAALFDIAIDGAIAVRLETW